MGVGVSMKTGLFFVILGAVFISTASGRRDDDDYPERGRSRGRGRDREFEERRSDRPEERGEPGGRGRYRDEIVEGRGRSFDGDRDRGADGRGRDFDRDSGRGRDLDRDGGRGRDLDRDGGRGRDLDRDSGRGRDGSRHGETRIEGRKTVVVSDGKDVYITKKGEDRGRDGGDSRYSGRRSSGQSFGTMSDFDYGLGDLGEGDEDSEFDGLRRRGPRRSRGRGGRGGRRRGGRERGKGGGDMDIDLGDDGGMQRSRNRDGEPVETDSEEGRRGRGRKGRRMRYNDDDFDGKSNRGGGDGLDDRRPMRDGSGRNGNQKDDGLPREPAQGSDDGDVGSAGPQEQLLKGLKQLEEVQKKLPKQN